jgi:hypothetical protein
VLSTGANTTTSRSSRRVADANGPRLELGTRGGAKATDGPLAFRHGESAPRLTEPRLCAQLVKGRVSPASVASEAQMQPNLKVPFRRGR